MLKLRSTASSLLKQYRFISSVVTTTSSEASTAEGKKDESSSDVLVKKQWAGSKRKNQRGVTEDGLGQAYIGFNYYPR